MSDGGRPMKAARKYKEKTLVMRTLTAEAEGLLAEAKPGDAKEVCRRVYEVLRYSDPMTGDAVAETEEKLMEAMKTFTKSVKENNTAEVTKTAEEMIRIAEERNRLNRLNK